jgi:hypothetical protein
LGKESRGVRRGRVVADDRDEMSEINLYDHQIPDRVE